jgi:hypothetical protein
MAARFYVYRLYGPDGATEYIGKGSGYRLTAQKRNKGLDGEIVAMFFKEADAYAYEVERIAADKPTLNRHPGGNGSKAIKRRALPRPKWVIDMEKIGTRVYAARFLLTKQYPFTASEIDMLRRAAHG